MKIIRRCFIVKKIYDVGIVVGIIVLFLAIPAGDLYGNFYLSIVGGMDTERFTMLGQSAIISFQVIGGVIFALCGVARTFKSDK